MRRILYGSFVVALVFLGVTTSAAPKSETAATISLDVPSGLRTAASSGIWPAIGDTVSFVVTFPKSVEKYDPRIQMLCYQGTSLVYGAAGPYTQSFLLGGGSSPWLNNTSTTDAHCVADLYYWSYQGGQKFNLLASTEFDAQGR